MNRVRAGLVLAYFWTSTTSHNSLMYISARVLLQFTSLTVRQMYCTRVIVTLSGGTSTFGAA